MTARFDQSWRANHSGSTVIRNCSGDKMVTISEKPTFSLSRKTCLLASCFNREEETVMEKATRRRYTLEYKQETVRLVSSCQKVAAAAKMLGIVEQRPANWVKADRSAQRRAYGEHPSTVGAGAGAHRRSDLP